MQRSVFFPLVLLPVNYSLEPSTQGLNPCYHYKFIFIWWLFDFVKCVVRKCFLNKCFVRVFSCLALLSSSSLVIDGSNSRIGGQLSDHRKIRSWDDMIKGQGYSELFLSAFCLVKSKIQWSGKNLFRQPFFLFFFWNLCQLCEPMCCLCTEMQKRTNVQTMFV